jgi:hypothetical protein
MGLTSKDILAGGLVLLVVLVAAVVRVWNDVDEIFPEE